MEDSGYRPRTGRDDGRYYGDGEGYRFGKQPERPVARKARRGRQDQRAFLLQLQGRRSAAGRFCAACRNRPVRLADQATSGTAFREAVAGLAGYELFAEPEDRQGAGRVLFRQSGLHLDHRQRDQRARPRPMPCGCWGRPASHGLSPADYAISIPSGGLSLADAAARKSELIRFEMALSARVLRYAARRRERPHQSQQAFRLP